MNINNYKKLVHFLEEIFVKIFFENQRISSEERILLEELGDNLNKNFNLKEINSPEDLISVFQKIGNKTISYPKSKLPLEMWIQLSIDKTELIRKMPKLEREKIGGYILSHSHVFEKLFVAQGIENKHFKNIFGVNIDQPSQVDIKMRKNLSTVLRFFTKIPVFGILMGFLIQQLFQQKHLFFLKAITSSNLFSSLALSVVLAGSIVIANKTVMNQTEVNGGQVLNWKFQEEMSINMVKEGTIKLLVNRKKKFDTKEKNIINFVLTSHDSKKGVFKEKLKTLRTDKNKINTIYQKEEGQFVIKKRGGYIVPNNQIHPSIRSIPSFPSKAVKPGDQWSMPCEFFFHDVKPSFLLMTNAYYSYLSNVEKDGKLLALIKIDTIFSEDVKKQLRTSRPDQISFIYAENNTLLWWNIKEGRPEYQEDKMEELITFISGDKQRWSMDFKSKIDVTYPINSKKISKLNKELNNIEGAKSSIEKDGIHVNLGDILFKYNSFELTGKAEGVLKKIGDILGKYGKYEIAIEGHTDDVGSVKYNQKLSISRAKEVAKYFHGTKNMNTEKMYVAGYGKSKPKKPNDSNENRRENRRVEIILKQSGK